MKVFCKTLTGSTITLEVEPNSTVKYCKKLIKRREKVGVSQQRIIFAGRLLEDNNAKLSDYNIQNESTIHMVLQLRGGGFEFSDLKKLEILQLSEEGPSYLTVKAGTNFMGTCLNPKCVTQKSRGAFVIPKGYGEINIMEEKEKQICCVECYQISKFTTLGFIDCEYSYSGFQSHQPTQEIKGSGVVAENEFHRFNNDSQSLTKWETYL